YAATAQDAFHPVVALVARVLEHLVVVVFLPRQQERPRSRPHRRIVDRRFVVDGLRADAREALDEMQASLRDASELLLVREVRRIDDQGVALPVTARVAVPLPDLLVEMRTAVQRDDAAIELLVLKDDVVGRLKNLCAAVVVLRKSRHHTRDAARVGVEFIGPRDRALIAEPVPGLRSDSV